MKRLTHVGSGGEVKVEVGEDVIHSILNPKVNTVSKENILGRVASRRDETSLCNHQRMLKIKKIVNDLNCDSTSAEVRCAVAELMLSEWLVEVPSDLAKQWYLKLCPIGKRCLIVASKGITKAYTKSGYNIMSFPSDLPGGNKIISSKPLHVYCFLDCIYHEAERTFYILDIMCWNSHPCFDSETEFRFYWMQAKINECTGLQNISKQSWWPLTLETGNSQGILKYYWKTQVRVGEDVSHSISNPKVNTVSKD